MSPSLTTSARLLMSAVLFLLFKVGALGAQPSSDAAFQTLLDEHWQAHLRRNPVFATSLGVRRYDDQLGDPSLAAYQAAVDESVQFLARAKAFDDAQLSGANALNRALFVHQLELEIQASQHGGRYMIMTNRNGPHLRLTTMVARLPFFDLADYHSYVNRLAQIPAYMQKATARLRAGVAAGWVQPCAPMQGFEKSIEAHVVTRAKKSVFFQPFETRPNTVSKSDFDALSKQALRLIDTAVIPAFAAFAAFYKTEYASACRAEVGTDSMPGGDAYYQHRVALFTTTDLSPDDVHTIGLKEVARIRSEMLDVIKRAEFKGSFSDWLEYLRDTPAFYPKTAQERMQAVAAITKKMDGELPKLFGKLPRMPYGLKEIPSDIAEKTTTAYYQRPAGDGSRAGFYFVNTSKLDTRPLYQLEALSLHEAVPGHHLQLALAQELALPNFRKYGGVTVFVEGWALYAERLGLEVGFYQTPYTNFGRLSYEMWRACRLVVDTGLHTKGWTRQQAIDFMSANSGLSMNNIVSEVDRYITWPGQALAYKIGELKIRELRAAAEQSLANRFDVRAFHDKILENGALPLSILERIMLDWIDDQRSLNPLNKL